MKILPATVEAEDLGDGAVTTAKLGAKAVTTAKEAIITQYGTAKAGAAYAQTYKAFPTAFGAAPTVILVPKDNDVDRMKVITIKTGSFSYAGSPGQPIFDWIARGSAA
jgi:hypothetical protein